MERQPTVFLVDDDPSTRVLVQDASKLMGLPCECFDSGEGFLNAYDASQPGCLLLEVRTSGLNGFQVQKHLAFMGGALPIIFIAARATVSIAVQALRGGATNFLEKPLRQHDLWNAVQEAVQLDKERRSARNQQELLDNRIGKLSEAQRTLLKLIAEGGKNQEIALALGVCVRTVEKRRIRLMQTLQVQSPIELLCFALYAGNGRNGSAKATHPQTWIPVDPMDFLLR